MMYTTKPHRVEAHPVRDLVHLASKDWFNLPLWVIEAYDRADLLFLPRAIRLHTPEGWRTAELDDYLIRTEGNFLWTVPADAFAREYEADQ